MTSQLEGSGVSELPDPPEPPEPDPPEKSPATGDE
jgi:hypothetical protein